MGDVATITTYLGNQGDPVEYTVAGGTAIPKGSLMHISASNTAAIAGNDGEFFAGISATEKTATDGVTKMACITHCVAEMEAGVGATTFGQPQKIGASANVVIDADDDTIENAGEVVGLALATQTDGNRFAILVNL
jgi:hypothetical protein